MENIVDLENKKEKILSFKKEINDKIEKCYNEENKENRVIWFLRDVSVLGFNFWMSGVLFVLSGLITGVLYVTDDEIPFMVSLFFGFLIALLCCLILSLIIIFLSECINNKADHFKIRYKNTEVFCKEYVEKYYQLLNEIFDNELEKIVIMTRKNGEEVGSLILLDKLFDQALEKLNKEIKQLKLNKEYEKIKKEDGENELFFANIKKIINED